MRRAHSAAMASVVRLFECSPSTRPADQRSAAVVERSASVRRDASVSNGSLRSPMSVLDAVPVCTCELPDSSAHQRRALPRTLRVRRTGRLPTSPARTFSVGDLASRVSCRNDEFRCSDQVDSCWIWQKTDIASDVKARTPAGSIGSRRVQSTDLRPRNARQEVELRCCGPVDLGRSAMISAPSFCQLTTYSWLPVPPAEVTALVVREPLGTDWLRLITGRGIQMPIDRETSHH